MIATFTAAIALGAFHTTTLPWVVGAASTTLGRVVVLGAGAPAGSTTGSTTLGKVVVLGAVKPTVLLYEEGLTADGGPPDVIRPMAAEMLRTGKVTPILYALGDPMISIAIDSGELKALPDKPATKDLFSVARIIGAQYVASCKVTRNGDNLEGDVQLYKTGNGRAVWNGKTSVSIMKDDKVDIESATVSVASTWVAQMNTTPFKDLAVTTKIDTPVPLDPSINHAPAIELDKTPLASGRKALQEGRVIEAVALLRDAVDVSPLDADARLSLIEALRLAGHPFLAAEEAGRAIDLIPGNSGLLQAAAISWLEGGQADKAYEYVQQALAKNPRDAGALSVMGDLLIGKLEFSRAADSYTQSIALQKDPETIYKRAQAYALMEEFDKSVADLDEAIAAGLSQDVDKSERRYRATVKILEPVFDSLAASVRNTLRESKGNESAIKPRAEALASRCESFMTYLDKLKPPVRHEKSHQQRGLAMNILRQAAAGLVKYVTSKSADDYGDAELLQIESMREVAAAKARFQMEVASR